MAPTVKFSKIIKNSPLLALALFSCSGGCSPTTTTGSTISTSAGGVTGTSLNTEAVLSVRRDLKTGNLMLRTSSGGWPRLLQGFASFAKWDDRRSQGQDQCRVLLLDENQSLCHHRRGVLMVLDCDARAFQVVSTLLKEMQFE